MNIFKTRTSWTNLDLAVLKLCAGSFYICIGIYFHEYLRAFLPVFAVVFVITTILILIIWAKKEKIRS